MKWSVIYNNTMNLLGMVFQQRPLNKKMVVHCFWEIYNLLNMRSMSFCKHCMYECAASLFDSKTFHRLAPQLLKQKMKLLVDYYASLLVVCKFCGVVHCASDIECKNKTQELVDLIISKAGKVTKTLSGIGEAIVGLVKR